MADDPPPSAPEGEEEFISISIPRRPPKERPLADPVPERPASRPLQAPERKVLEVLFFGRNTEWWTVAQVARGTVTPPSKIESEAPAFSEGTAKKGLAQLAARNVLETSKQVPKHKKAPTVTYKLSPHPVAASEVLALYLNCPVVQTEPWRAIGLMRSPYGRYAITDALVRHVLAVRQVGCYLTLPLADGVFMRRGTPGNMRVQATPHYIAVRTPYEEPDVFLRRLLNEFGDAVEPAERSAITEALAKHCHEEEDRLLIVPITALITISHRALRAFLDAWEPHGKPRHRFEAPLYGAIEHVLYALIFAALFEVSSSRQLPGGWVKSAEANPRIEADPKRPAPILELELHAGHKIRYSTGFRAPPIMMLSPTGMLLPPWENPSQAWAHITWVEAPPQNNDLEDVVEENE